MNEKLFTVRLSEDGGAVEIIDQTLLPNTIKYLRLEKAEDIWEAIFSLRVRGAPAIGVAAGFGMYVLAQQISDEDYDAFLGEMERIGAYLDSSRPTAVNLSFAVKRMLAVVHNHTGLVKSQLLPLLKAECMAVYNEDRAMCRAISENGLTLVKNGDGILTHCNAGALAATEYGTGLGTLLLGKELGYEFKVFTDETRPLLQGARLTSFELNHAGIDVTLICDNAASLLMKQGKINACFVGCDRVAANGDTANKIGTRSVAVNAKYHGVPFYVFCPSSTIDFSCRSGDDIVIEERSGDEIKTMFFEKPVAEAEVKCFNPAFDVTDAELITAIITEKGIARYPYTESLAKLFL
ncbi:MAG: S-methyl-5-thioribose-1-phosphate isomerase [Oscillospiraceae bacterium]|nr:S-methyl-5-thioribose-1-phosphate isomerase [Oscillospiraceae bacterium]